MRTLCTIVATKVHTSYLASVLFPWRSGEEYTWHGTSSKFTIELAKYFNLSIVSKVVHFKSVEGEETPPHTPTFFFLSFLASLLLARDVWLFPNSGSSKVQLVMSLILFILYGCSVWKKERREGAKRGDGVAEGDFQCSCMYNE